MELKIRVRRAVFPEAGVFCVVVALLVLGARLAKGQDNFHDDPVLMN